MDVEGDATVIVEEKNREKHQKLKLKMNLYAAQKRLENLSTVSKDDTKWDIVRHVVHYSIVQYLL